MQEHGSDPGEATGLEVAVVGMAGRFPGAADIHAFWRNLRDGVESIRFFSRAELAAAGTDDALLDHPDFVPARGELAGADEFDAGLFHLTPRDAEILDPQHRVLLECAWAALEHAGYDPARVDRPVGVFAGCSTSGYLANLAASPELMRSVGTTRLLLGNEKDHLAAGISYRLNLRGPSLAVQTACSTSMVAVHLACQSLLAGECDMALAGGAGIGVPLRTGYLYVPEGIASPDGHCRAFDAEARGTVGGSGAGMVALRRLEDALADGDTIHAVIRGSAINNDGAQKVGYTAPSVTGQARVLSEALAAAQVDPSTIHYLEAHGSGTPLGDAIELKAVGQVLAGVEGHRWAIGSVKTNVGHLDAAAGITGFIKTVMSLKHQQIPPSLHCTVPHPEIEASGGRVFVNTELRPWERNGTPRRAGVSSFGIGGTNAHVILEEAPVPEPSGPSRALQLLVLSARTPEAAAAAARNLAAHLEAESPGLADAAFTLQTGRREMEHRLAVVCADAAEGAAGLREAAAGGAARAQAERPAAFLFPGLGMHHVDMGRGLYDAEPVFRDAVDECCELLLPVLGSDLRAVMYGDSEDDGPAAGGWNLRAMLGRDAAPLPAGRHPPGAARRLRDGVRAGQAVDELGGGAPRAAGALAGRVRGGVRGGRAARGRRAAAGDPARPADRRAPGRRHARRSAGGGGAARPPPRRGGRGGGEHAGKLRGLRARGGDPGAGGGAGGAGDGEPAPHHAPRLSLARDDGRGGGAGAAGGGLRPGGAAHPHRQQRDGDVDDGGGGALAGLLGAPPVPDGAVCGRRGHAARGAGMGDAGGGAGADAGRLGHAAPHRRRGRAHGVQLAAPSAQPRGRSALSAGYAGRAVVRGGAGGLAGVQRGRVAAAGAAPRLPIRAQAVLRGRAAPGRASPSSSGTGTGRHSRPRCSPREHTGHDGQWTGGDGFPAPAGHPAAPAGDLGRAYRHRGGPGGDRRGLLSRRVRFAASAAGHPGD